MKWDYLIVGQGLAGSILSYQLIENDLKVLVFDQPGFTKSSAVAAGIYNPFTGRKLVKTWMADELFKYLLKFYKSLELQLGVPLLFEMPMYRPFLSVQEQNQWGSRINQVEYQQFIDYLLSPPHQLPEIVNPLGGLMLKNCGYLDVVGLMNAITNYLKQKNLYRAESFSYSDVKISKDEVLYQGHTARKIIFCEGPFLKNNHFFNWLPLKPVKGEILDIEIDHPLDYIVNRGVFVLPNGQRLCRVGSTFDNQDLTNKVTDKARARLIEKLDRLIKFPYRIKGQQAGVRPATLDRRPFIGLHPEFEPLVVFNGLGTKGVSLAPYWARELFEFLERGKPLNKDVAISRYFSLYYNKI